MSIKKEYLKDTGYCRVKFILPSKIFNCRKKAYLVGDFNDWDTQKTLMRKQKNGSYSTTLDLPIGKEYQFRYFIDDVRWENDDEADGHAPTPFPGQVNSVIIL
jgi:1,4-alpha-glucan branching enzyme